MGTSAAPTTDPAKSPPTSGPTTQPSNQPAPSPSPTSPWSGLSAEEKDRLLSQQAEVIRGNARKTAELESSLQELRKKVDAGPPPPPPDPKVGRQQFFDDPVNKLEELRTTIKKDMEETVKPLIEFKGRVEGDSVYAGIKNDFKADPRFKEFLSLPGVEAMVDSMMTKLNKTPDAMLSVVAGLKGSMELGLVPKPSGSPAPAAPAAPRSGDLMPPNLRPSSAPLPDRETQGDKAKQDYIKGEIEKLDENARRLIREMGMSNEDYIAWRDEQAIDVPTSKIGIKPPEPKK